MMKKKEKKENAKTSNTAFPLVIVEEKRGLIRKRESKWGSGFQIQNWGNFLRNAILSALSLKSLFLLAIGVKPYYKLIKSIVDLSFMTI